MHDETRERQIKRAEETQAVLARIDQDPSPENIVALHRLHAAHLREAGDLVRAERSEARAQRVKGGVGKR
jgi:hypothetical protein